MTSNNGHPRTDPDPLPPRLPNPLVTWAVIGVLAVVAVVALVVAIRSGDTSPDAGVADAAVERVVPGRGDQEPRQSRVGLDLVTGWSVEQMTINGVNIPADQWTVNEGLAQVWFEPGPGKELERLDAGDVCVVAVIYSLLDAEERRTVNWCFRAI